jgi:hypothetical protein
MTAGWFFTEHACRACLGSVLQRGSDFICSICRAEAKRAPDGICGCGIAVKGPASRRRAGFRCVPNPAPGPSNPSHVLISFGAEAGQVKP